MLKYTCSVLRRSPLLQTNKYYCYIPNLMTTHIAEMTMRATRRQFLNKAVLNQNKQVIHAEVRQPEDKVLTLKQAGKCPGVIIPISGKKEEQIDVVLGGKAMKSRFIKPQYGRQKVFVKVEGKDHMCILKEVRMSVKNFIEKVFFQEYVPGQPNHLHIPIQLTHVETSKFFHRNYQFRKNINFIDIICYNHDYPATLYIDVSYVNLDRPYTIGDLANTFPPGIILHPKYNTSRVIFEFYKDDDTQVGDVNIDEIMSNINYGKEDPKAKNTAGGGGAAAAAAPAATPAKKGK